MLALKKYSKFKSKGACTNYSKSYFFLTVYFQNRVIMIYVQNNICKFVYDGNLIFSMILTIFPSGWRHCNRKTEDDQYSRFEKMRLHFFSTINWQRDISRIFAITLDFFLLIFLHLAARKLVIVPHGARLPNKEG